MALVAASSAQSLPKKYHVFMSFRGEDTRSNFASHLYDALCRKHIITYIDYQLPKGDDISQSLLQAIEDSYISVVVFSENYASSSWCLDELIHILHCKRVQGQIVVPVFYKVEPTHVRNQTENYKQAFERYERDHKFAEHRIQMWKQALHEAANLAGYDSHTFRDEAELIQKIVKYVLHKLNNIFFSNHGDDAATVVPAGADLMDEAQSCCGSTGGVDVDGLRDDGGNEGWVKSRMCRQCGREESCVLMLPCRHLCLCTVCDSYINICPVCRCSKNASLQVSLS